MDITNTNNMTPPNAPETMSEKQQAEFDIAFRGWFHNASLVLNLQVQVSKQALFDQAYINRINTKSA